MRISRERMTLVSDAANEVLGDCQHIDNDWSLAALVRAIVIKYSDLPMEKIGENTAVHRLRARTQRDMNAMLQSCSAAITVAECIGCFDEEVAMPDGWKSEFSFNGKPFPVNQYLSQYCRTKIYINEEERHIVAFVDRRATHIWVQAFESVICRLMTWYFPPELSDEEKSFYKSIAVDNKTVTSVKAANNLVRFVNDAATKFDFRAVRLHRFLDGIADRARQSRMSELRERISRTHSEINNYREAISIRFATLDSSVMELNGLEATPPATDDAMFNFFNNHKQVTVLDVTDISLRFGVDDTLEFYDEDEFERIFKSTHSYLAERNDKIRKALWNIFKEHRGVIRIQAVFDLCNFKLIEPKARNQFINDCMPNPHIYYHACSGGNETYYYQYAESGDWDLAIEQAISATKNVNWGDSTVCKKLVAWLVDNSTTPCIYVADGLTPVEIVDKSMKLISFGDFMAEIEKMEGEKTDG